MVFKKPYAFLIKNFKVFHLILSALMIYLSIKINLITDLFNRLADNISMSMDGLANKYISGILFFVLFLIIAIAFVIWFLMKNKQKPTKYYIFIMGYYILLIIFLIIYRSALISLEEVSMTNNALRAYSDISFLLPLGQYYFIVVAILRGIGFNIKQFNFSKDIKDLEISEEDSEEIEVNLSNNTYKYQRKGRKYLRELKYYFFENKYWILLIFGIVLVGLIIYFFVNHKFVNNNYSQRNIVNVGVYNVLVNKVFVTNKDLYGEIINKDKKYVIVDMKVKNNFYESIELDIKKFLLCIGGEYYYPITNKNSSFEDLGLPYDGKYLDTESEYNYILIYELNKKEKTNNMSLKAYKSLDYEKNKAIFANIKLNEIYLNKDLVQKNIKLNEDIIIDEELFLNSKVNIKDYSLINNYEYNYEMCYNDKCSEKTGVIVPDDVLNKKLIRIEYGLNVDNESSLFNFIKNDKKFFNTFAQLSYTYNGKNKVLKFNGLDNINIKNQIFMEVSKEIDLASSIELIINTRLNKYIYKLK